MIFYRQDALCVTQTLGIYSVLRGVATGGISIYIPQNQSTFKKNSCGCSSPVTQDRFDMIYVHEWDINMFLELQ